jgi:hypothetical protein
MPTTIEELEELEADDDLPGITAPRAAPPPPVSPSASSSPSSSRPAEAATGEGVDDGRRSAHLVQQVGDRTVEVYAYLDGARILFDSVEVHGTPGAARHAFESLLQRLGAEGFLPR